MSPDARLELLRHCETPSRVACRISTHVSRRNNRLRLSFSLDGDLTRLRVPAAAATRRTDELWKHTCFEAFIARIEATGYHEFNFAPSGEWAAYVFRDYRAGCRHAADALAPEIDVHRGATRLQLDAVIRLDRLSAAHVVEPLRLALAAVVEDESGALSYWALAHAPGNPDFHHPDSFVLPLTADAADIPDRARLP